MEGVVAKVSLPTGEGVQAAFVICNSSAGQLYMGLVMVAHTAHCSGIQLSRPYFPAAGRLRFIRMCVCAAALCTEGMGGTAKWLWLGYLECVFRRR